MTDLTPFVVAAITNAGMWSLEQCRNAARELAEHLRGTVVWNEGAGDTWMTIMRGREGCAMLSTQIPLAFVLRRCTTGTRQLNDAAVIVVLIDSWDDSIFCLDAQCVPAFGGGRSPEIDLSGFSINDLYWGTV